MYLPHFQLVTPVSAARPPITVPRGHSLIRPASPLVNRFCMADCSVWRKSSRPGVGPPPQRSRRRQSVRQPLSRWLAGGRGDPGQDRRGGKGATVLPWAGFSNPLRLGAGPGCGLEGVHENVIFPLPPGPWTLEDTSGWSGGSSLCFPDRAACFSWPDLTGSAHNTGLSPAGSSPCYGAFTGIKVPATCRWLRLFGAAPLLNRGNCDTCWIH